MSRVNEVKAYIRVQQSKVNQLGSNDKILLKYMIDELRQEHNIETVVSKDNKVTFKSIVKVVE